jgi:TolB-like protein
MNETNNPATQPAVAPVALNPRRRGSRDNTGARDSQSAIGRLGTLSRPDAAEQNESADDAAAQPAPEDTPAGFWQRLKRTNVVQWSVAYIALACAIQRAIMLGSDHFDWPYLVTWISMPVLAFSVPIVISFAWDYGARAPRLLSGVWATAVATVFTASAAGFFLFLNPSNQVARNGAANSAGPISVAVLPFQNPVSTSGQDFFADGATEELASALSKSTKLRVVGRLSAFELADQSNDNRAAAQALGATHLIKGSLRKDTNHISLTVQLIRADSGAQLWTSSYDGDLKDLSALDITISQAIAGALKVPPAPNPAEAVGGAMSNPDNYQDFLRARSLVRARGYDGLKQAAALMEKFVAREPNYAPGFVVLANAYVLQPGYNTAWSVGSADQLRRIGDGLIPKAESAARHAIQLDARSADAYAVLGLVQQMRGAYSDAEQSFQQALVLDPSNPDALHNFSLFLAAAGRVKQALAMREQLRQTEPLVPVFNLDTAALLRLAGQYDRALDVAEHLPDGDQRAASTARILAATGRYKEAGYAISEGLRGTFDSDMVDDAVRVLWNSATGIPVQDAGYLGPLSWVFVHDGLPERGLEFQQAEADAGYTLGTSVATLWGMDYADARKTDAFKALVKKLGLVDYWRARGWPEFCHPLLAGEFACN